MCLGTFSRLGTSYMTSGTLFKIFLSSTASPASAVALVACEWGCVGRCSRPDSTPKTVVVLWDLGYILLAYIICGCTSFAAVHRYGSTSCVVHPLWHIRCGTSLVAVHLLWYILCGSTVQPLRRILCGTTPFAAHPLRHILCGTSLVAVHPLWYILCGSTSLAAHF